MKYRWIWLLLLFTVTVNGAQVIRYVDPDATGAGNGTSWTDAYTLLSAWNSGEATNLVSAGDYHTVYCRSSGGTDDTTPFTLGTGWTTAAANYIEIIGDDFPSDGIWDDSAYILHNNDSAVTAIDIKEDYVRFRNLQILVTSATNNTRLGLYISTVGISDIRLDSCIIKGVCSGTGASQGIYCGDTSGAGSIYNCVIYGFNNPPAASFTAGIRFNFGTFNIFNCTIYDCYYGILDSSANPTIKNCAIGNCVDDIFSNNTIDYCCTDDSDGANGQNPSGSDWANEFNDAANGDFTLVSGGNCIGNGTDDPGSGLYSDDITGTTRSSTWDIGAYEYTTPPPTPAGDGGANIIRLWLDAQQPPTNMGCMLDRKRRLAG